MVLVAGAGRALRHMHTAAIPPRLWPQWPHELTAAAAAAAIAAGGGHCCLSPRPPWSPVPVLASWSAPDLGGRYREPLNADDFGKDARAGECPCACPGQNHTPARHTPYVPPTSDAVVVAWQRLVRLLFFFFWPLDLPRLLEIPHMPEHVTTLRCALLPPSAKDSCPAWNPPGIGTL